jgi:hypothetical protein
MPRRPILNDHTAGEEHQAFLDVLGQLGMSGSEREAALQHIPIDGIRGSDRPRERRHAETSYYSKPYAEAQSAAGLVVDLRMADAVSDIRRLSPPLPDIEVALNDQYSIFIEQTDVMDQGARTLSLAVERANYRALELVRTNQHAAKAIEDGMFFVRLDHLTYDRVGQPTNGDDLAAELCALAATLKDAEFLIAPDATRYPILSGLGARYSYKPGVMMGGIIMPPMDHGRLSELEPTLRERIASKISKRAGYGSLAGPLWLVVDVDHHFYVGAEDLRAISTDVISVADLTGFDLVAIQHLGQKPQIFNIA